MDRETAGEARYTLIRKLGEGGMGEVWLAHDELLRRPLALKRIHPGGADGSLEREARALAALHHPNIVAIHDIVHVGGLPYLAMEFIDGQSIAARLRGGSRFSEDEVRRIGLELADALAFAHSHGVLHNDVKPSNVLIDRSGKAHLTDFGVARSDRTTASLARTNSVIGTIAYLAPELFEGAQPSPLTDQYALGATLFEAATGQPPFTAGAAGVAQRLAKPAPAISSLVPDFSQGLEQPIARALSTNPSKRFPSVGLMAAALRGEATQRIAISAVPGARGRRWPAALALAGLAALLFAAIALWRSDTNTGSTGANDGVLAGQPHATPAISESPTVRTTAEAQPTATAPPPTVSPTDTPFSPGRIGVVVAPPAQGDHAKEDKAGHGHGKDH